MNKLLYIAANDGTDARVVKELKTLSREFDLVFLGCSRKKNKNNFLKNLLIKKITIPLSHRNLLTYFFFNVFVIYFRIKYRFNSIHIVDEQTFLFVWPSCLFKPVILDIFDSIFLKLNLHGERFLLIKSFIYSLVKVIIVTDEARKSLLPTKYQNKAVVVPNFPFQVKGFNRNSSSHNSDVIKIGCFGSLSLKRDIAFLDSLTKISPTVKIICAGWVSDDKTNHTITNNKSFAYLGVLPQSDILKIISDMDFISMIYPRDNINNKYASPNKLYDAIQIGVPVLCNDDINISKEIYNNGFGILVSRNEISCPTLSLLEKIRSFNALSAVQYNEYRLKYCWDNYEPILLGCHFYRL